MAQDYAEYLAIHVLNEQQFVNYRNLSRALKIHCNLAKQMLYEFHRKQNSKKPGSVHATYLLTGIKRPTRSNDANANSQDNEGDTLMQSSPPFPSSSMPQVDDDDEETISVRSIMLVKEADLEQAKASFDSITGIHVYSLQANAVNDLQVLTECNRKVAADYASEDPLQAWKQYGVIQNPYVRRRTRKGPPASAATAAVSKQAASKASPAQTTAKPPVLEKQTSAGSRPTSKESSAEPSKAATTKKSATNKAQGTDFFKAFAKGAAKSKKTESQDSAPAPLPEDDVPMTGFSDEDDEDGEGGLPEELSEVKAPSGKSKKQREDELKAMMEQEDEEMDDAVPTPTPDDEGAIDQAEKKEDEPQETVTVEQGRRRGRRRIMKKKTVKDEEGYLVTKEEPAWESFSEDEPAPKKAKVAPPAPAKPAAGGKKGAKPSGNIMSFFSKK